ncbi:hypothetical protein ACFLVS_07290 [Chloroflexota bacterium]
MRLLKNSESGQALIMALIMLAMGGLFVVPTLNLASTCLNYHRVIEENTKELYAADSGMQYTVCKLRSNVAAFGPEDLPSAVNGKTVTIMAENMGESIYKLNSTATSADGSNTTIESYIEAGRGPFGNAVTVTNGDLILQGTDIDGDVYAGGDILLEESTVTGTVTEYGTDEFDLLDTDPYKEEALSGGTINGNLIIGAGTHDLGPIYITGYLKIQEGAQVTMDGTVYVEGLEKMLENNSIHIEAGSSLVGTGNLIAEDGDIKIEVATFDLDNIPLVAALTGAIKLENCTYIEALLYAPEVNVGLLHTEESMSIYGSIFTSTLVW